MTQGAQPGALYQPRGVGWGRRWEGGSREREHVDTRQKPTQYCKAIILQLKINLKKEFKSAILFFFFSPEKVSLSHL